MAMTVVYYCMDGEILAENRGGIVTHLIPDTLGNVIETRDEAWNKTSETTYWPYGEVRTQTGSNPTPWGFVGTLGYYIDGLAGLYVRARHLMSRIARWLTKDLLWPSLSPYSYVELRPDVLSDESGLKPKHIQRPVPVPGGWPEPDCGSLPTCMDKFNCCKDKAQQRKDFGIQACLAGLGLIGILCTALCSVAVNPSCLICLGFAAAMLIGCMFGVWNHYTDSLRQCENARKVCGGMMPPCDYPQSEPVPIPDITMFPIAVRSS